MMRAVLLLISLLTVALAAELARAQAAASPAAMPQWIWGAEKAQNDETFYFRKSFELPVERTEGVRARLWGTCDNEFVVHVNGEVAVWSSTWERPVNIDVSKLIRPGRNTIAIKGRNAESAAGLIAALRLNLPGRRQMAVVSDGSWVVSSEPPEDWQATAFDDSNWTKAHVIGKLGIQPWGNLPGADGRPIQATAAESLTLLPGFKAQLLFSVPKETHNSWVAMCSDPKGRLIVSGQDGPLFRVTPGNDAASTVVEPIDLPIGHAQGLLYAFDSLYVTVNGRGIGGNGSGFYRVRDTDGDDRFDEVKQLMPFRGGGEHGPHAIRLSPDGKSLYVIAGNHTRVPERLRADSPVQNYAEDHLLPRNPDGNGHATGVMAPGGWIAITDPEGKEWSLFCSGFRNTYDMDFNLDGELFTYDADMEYDTGAPWYRPTRVNLCTSAAEYGWRYGTGKWPDYYADSLGAVVNMGLGSPTGVAFGTGAKFPAKYQRALFCNDWTYGKVYAVHLTPDGAGYKGTFETFVEGRPFGVTDIVINTDGAMYITIGGRGTQSGLYRVTYVGSEPTSPAGPAHDPAAAEARALRRKLESYHGRQDSQAIDFIWTHLNSGDRYIRFAARVALEWQDVRLWQERALQERRPTAAIHALLALSRTGDKSLQPRILESLNRLALPRLSEEQLLDACRAYGLCFIRMGRPDPAMCSTIAARFDALYPAQSTPVNRELCQILTYLESPPVIAKSMALLAGARTQEDQLYYVFVLRNMAPGWMLEQRKAYFSWLSHAEQKYSGGASFKKFLIRIREDAIKTLSDQERPVIEAFIEEGQSVQVVQDIQPRQFVRNWQMQDLLPALEQVSSGRSFESGKAAYEAVQCATCHRFADDGGSSGPDLTGVGNRFSPADLLEAILLPNQIISDQYENTEISTKDKDFVVGRVESEDDEKVLIRTHPLSPEPVAVLKTEIVLRRPSRISMMPEGLIDVLTQEEILDMLAYLRSAGNPDDAAFRK